MLHSYCIENKNAVVVLAPIQKTVVICDVLTGRNTVSVFKQNLSKS